MIVGILFITLVVMLIWSVFYGQKLIRTEKTDAVFGNPSRALGGWHWVIAGVSSIMLIWFYFSWDAARTFFPTAGNELCQVAKLNRTTNPIRSAFPLNDRLLRGTELLQRDLQQIDLLDELLVKVDFSDHDRAEIASVIEAMRQALLAQTAPALMDADIKARFDGIAARINQLAGDITVDGYSGAADPAQAAKALAQPGWGRSSVEIPALAITDRGRKFATAAAVMETISNDFIAIKNDGSAITAKLKAVQQRYEGLVIDQTGAPEVVAERTALVKQIGKILKRIDDGKIFPASITMPVEQALINFDDVQKSEQGSLRYIDIFAMGGGTIDAGNNACSEQGSGRWLPKPSDTLATFNRMANPEVGYKGFPLLWYRMQPLSELLGFLVPDWVADLVPGEYPRHSDGGEISNNFKSKVYNFATGNYSSLSIPIPSGHIWDSIVRVITGLLLGIVLGVPLGLFMGLSRFAKGYFDPLIELYRPIPPLAWAPLVLTIFGIQDDGKIFLLFMVAFAIMVISARTGATGTQLSKIHAAHSLGATKKQIIRRVILPNSLPEILTGIRIAIGVCWGTLVAAEMLAGTTGIGFVENVARKQSDYEIIWMTIILLGLLGLIFDMIMRWVIHRLIPWRGKG